MDHDFEQAVRDVIDANGVPGVGVAITCRGDVDIRGFGVANASTREAMAATSRYPLHSITKTYTATAVMRLVEQGELDLDAPLREYMPDFRVADADASARVCVRHLLTHTSGWVGDADERQIAALGDLDGEDALARAVAAMSGVAQITPAGATFSYSNLSYLIAGRLIEVVRGEPFERALATMVLEPLGMSATSFGVDEGATGPTVAGHEPGEGGAPAVFSIPPSHRVEGPSGGLWSTLEDQVRWLRFWLSSRAEGSDVLTPQTRRRMIERQSEGGGLCDAVGIGWMLLELDEGVAAVSYGSGRGMETMALFVPDHEFGLMLFANASVGYAVERRVTELALSGYLGRSLRERGPLARRSSAADEFSGNWLWHGVGRLGVAADDGNLAIGLADFDGVDQWSVNARVSGEDELVVTDGPYAGLRSELVRLNGEITGLRFMGRVCPRES